MIYNVYTISIGDATILYSDEHGNEYVKLGVLTLHDDECIELGFMDTTTKYNKKRISTNNFSKLLEQTTDELYDIFMGDYGFFRSPEVSNSYPISSYHLSIIERAIEDRLENYPNCINLIPYKGLEPDNFESLKLIERIEISKEYDWVYANLIWLRFWFDKALSTADYPCIQIKPMLQ